MITPSQAQKFSHGHWIQKPSEPHKNLSGTAYDTRKLKQEQIFFAFKTSHGDAHQHLQQIHLSTIKLLITDHKIQLPHFKGAILQTNDTATALASMARELLKLHNPPVVAISGSHGKTITKEMVAHAVSQALPILKTPASLNNEIGVPLSLLNLDGNQRALILEFSARKAGDIKFLCDIAPPTIAVLLNVGHAHIGIFGTQEIIYQTKAELFSCLKPEGTALWSIHDQKLGKLARKLSPKNTKIQSFGLQQSDFHATNLQYNPQGYQQFTAVHQKTKLKLQAGIPGSFGSLPMLAAWGVCRALNLPDDCLQHLNNWHPQQPGRMQLSKSHEKATLIDDTYNASPETIIALSQTLALRPEDHKILVIGPCNELEDGLANSCQILAQQLPTSLNAYLVYDPENSGLAQGLQKIAPTSIQKKLQTFSSASQLLQALNHWNTPKAVLGFKASRSAHLERFVLALQGTQVDCQKTNCNWLKRCINCHLLTTDN